jgi:hypothetical protein
VSGSAIQGRIDVLDQLQCSDQAESSRHTVLGIFNEVLGDGRW